MGEKSVTFYGIDTRAFLKQTWKKSLRDELKISPHVLESLQGEFVS